jgi:hypothetical protein
MDVETERENRRIRAEQSNQKLQREILRVILVRAVLLLGCIVGTALIVCYLSPSEPGFFLALMIPVALGCIFALLLLDAIGQRQEVKERRWFSLTPRFEKPARDTAHTEASTAIKPTS